MFVLTPERPFQPPKVLTTQLRKSRPHKDGPCSTQPLSRKQAEPAMPTTKSREDTDGGSELPVVLIMLANNDQLSLVSCKLQTLLEPPY